MYDVDNYGDGHRRRRRVAGHVGHQQRDGDDDEDSQETARHVHGIHLTAFSAVRQVISLVPSFLVTMNARMAQTMNT